MSKVVVDASVAIKWMLPDQPEEADVEQALALLARIGRNELRMLQPPHFLPEVVAVLARLAPAHVDPFLLALSDLEMLPADGVALYRAATALAIQLNHHLFDTLYHAAALTEPDATLITADRRYFDKAAHLGRIVWLADYR